MNYQLIQAGKNLLTDNAYKIAERIEELLDAKIGFFISLNHQTKNGYQVYLHTDNEDDLSDAELTTLDTHYGINTHDEDNTDFAIKELLNIKIQPETEQKSYE